MTLSELCDPLFQYVCLLNRSARKAGGPGALQVRNEIKSLLAEMRQTASRDEHLVGQYEQVEPVLLYFADFMMRQSGLSFAAQWQDLAAERGESDGDEKFFDLLGDTLADPRPAAAERLQVFYNCLGLGFTGWYQGQPEILRRKMLEIASRIRSFTEADQSARIVPEAYEHVNTSNLVTTPSSSLLPLAIAVLGLLVVLFAANTYLFRQSSSSLTNAVQRIVQVEEHGK